MKILAKRSLSMLMAFVLIVSLFSWIRKTLLGVAMAFGAVQGILAPAIDGLKRTAVVQSASVIPGIGDLIGGAWETVMGAGTVLKNWAEQV